jgi:hypothetical protein
MAAAVLAKGPGYYSQRLDFKAEGRMRTPHGPGQEMVRVSIALVVVVAVVTAVYCWPTNLLVDLAVPPAVFGVLILLRTRPRGSGRPPFGILHR